jgi:DNA-binding NtrC family response regulator
VLIVDDEPRILRSLKAAFKLKYTVLTAENAQAAKEIIQQEGGVDALIADDRMPKTTGYELLLWSRKHFPDTARILLSDDIDLATPTERAKPAEVFSIIHKPWDINHFEQILGTAVAQSQALAVERSRGTHEDISPGATMGERGTLARKLRVAPRQSENQCMFALMDSDPSYQSMYCTAGRKIKGLSTILLCKSSEKLLAAVSASWDIGVVCIDLSMGHSEARQLLLELQKTNPKIQRLLTGSASSVNMFNSTSEKSLYSQLIVKPVSMGRLLPQLTIATNTYLANKNI